MDKPQRITHPLSWVVNGGDSDGASAFSGGTSSGWSAPYTGGGEALDGNMLIDAVLAGYTAMLCELRRQMRNRRAVSFFLVPLLFGMTIRTIYEAWLDGSLTGFAVSALFVVSSIWTWAAARGMRRKTKAALKHTEGRIAELNNIQRAMNEDSSEEIMRLIEEYTAGRE